MANNKKKREKRSIKTGLIILWGLFLITLLVMFGAVYAIANGWMGNMPEITELENPVNKFASKVYTHDEKLMGSWSYAGSNRFIMPFDSLPKHLVQALVDNEDERFFEHSGIDMRALGRVLVKRGFMGEESAGGGSTITQQLAKQLYSGVTAKTTLKERMLQKPVEWYIATLLERYYTKEEIITMYLNYFDFLNNAVGIKSASRTYFAKDPIDLSLDEAATLVGMCKNPSYFNPKLNPERMKSRRNVVLDKMYELGHISLQELEEAKSKPMDTSKFNIPKRNDGFAPYFKEHLRIIMMAKKPQRSKYEAWQYQKYADDSLAWETDPLYGWCNKHTKNDGTNYNIYTDGLRIYTTIDSRMQQYAEEAVREHLSQDLQPTFYKHWQGDPKAPFVLPTEEDVENIMILSMKRSERYRVLKKAGWSLDSIIANFNTPIPMTVFSWEGPIDTVFSPMDSIRYYKYFLQSSLMSVETGTGYVKAYVGGNDYRFFQYDHVTQAKRQVGSTFKPFLYSLAMQEGEYTPCTKVPNISYSIQLPDGKFWEPKDSGKNKFGEEVTLRWALAHSNNRISAYLMKRFGPEAVIQMARRMGVTSDIPAVPSICLGVCDISLYEMVGAMSTFANKGVYTKPIFITKIEDKNGNVIETFKAEQHEAMDDVTAYKMIELMKGVVYEGTGIRLRFKYGLRNPIAGKTGTTQNQSDGWFMGITPDLTTGVWTGAEDRSVHFKTISLGQGSNMALPVWALYMKKVYADPTLNISQGDFIKPLSRVDLDFDCDKYETQKNVTAPEENEEDEF